MGVVIIKKGDITRVSQWHLWSISKSKKGFHEWLKEQQNE